MSGHKKSLITVCLMAAGSLAAQAADESSQKLAKAKELIDKGKAKSAIVVLRDIIRSSPNNAEAHMQLGAALAASSENDKYDEAIAEEEKALKLDPKSAAAHRILGMIYANQQKLELSIETLKTACKLQPSSFAAQRDLAKAYLAAGKPDESIAAFKKALEIKPENAEIHSKLATLLAQKGNYNDAIAEATKAVSLAESRAETHLILANIRLESGDSSGSIESFKNALAANGYDSLGCKNPMIHANALSGLGWAIATEKNATKEKITEALTYQKKALKAYPGYLSAYIRTAELLSRQGKNKDAESMYQNLFKSSQQAAAVGLPYAQFLCNLKRQDEAKNVLKAVLAKYPHNRQAEDALAAIEQAKTK